MPRSNVIEDEGLIPDEEEKPSQAKGQGKGRSGPTKRVLELAREEDDVFDVLLSSNSKLASIYLIAEKAAERAVMDLLLKMNFLGGGGKGSSSDDELKKFIIEKLKKEEEERRALKQTLLPLITEIITSLKLEKAYNECVQDGMVRLLLSGQVSIDAMEKIREQCRQMVSQTKGLVSNIVGKGVGNEGEDVEI